MPTLNQVIKSLNDIADNHLQINHFFFGEIYDFATSGDTNYPAMVVEKTPDTLSGSTLTVAFNVYVIQQVRKDISDRQEALSDMQLIALDIIYQLTHPSYEWVIDQNIILNDFVDKWDDEVTGYWFQLRVKISSPFDRCAIPMEPITISGSGKCSPATIRNSDSSYSDSVASGDTLVLPDEIVNVYVDGVLKSTASRPPLSNEDINIIWT